MKVTLNPIGTIYTPFETEVPRQANQEIEGDFKIEIDPKFQAGLNHLDQFNYLYVLFYLDRLKDDTSLIAHPPNSQIEVGVFASRSPRRPNHIALSITKIKKIEGNIIYTSCIDALNNTPLLDIKPYFKHLDIKLDANNGWKKID